MKYFLHNFFFEILHIRMCMSYRIRVIIIYGKNIDKLLFTQFFLKFCRSAYLCHIISDSHTRINNLYPYFHLS